jgi:hypothetical protein
MKKIQCHKIKAFLKIQLLNTIILLISDQISL